MVKMKRKVMGQRADLILKKGLQRTDVQKLEPRMKGFGAQRSCWRKV